MTRVSPEEPGALTGHARIRGGESQQWLIYPPTPTTETLASYEADFGLQPEEIVGFEVVDQV